MSDSEPRPSDNEKVYAEKPEHVFKKCLQEQYTEKHEIVELDVTCRAMKCLFFYLYLNSIIFTDKLGQHHFSLTGDCRTVSSAHKIKTSKVFTLSRLRLLHTVGLNRQLQFLAGLI